MMRAFYSEDQRSHDPQTFMVAGVMREAAEQPERADRLHSGGQAAGLRFEAPQAHDLDAIADVHTPEYLRFLQTIHARWSEILGASPEVIPNLHLDRSLGGYPSSPTGQAAYHQADTACPIGAGTWNGALWSARSAISATDAVLAGERSSYALCRPPGHHAYGDLAGGFCFLNNSAIAAQMLRSAYSRVAILDVDVHHGNGTQGIFYARDDVLTVSLHSDPETYYPFLCGYAHERGTGAGQGYNLNIPLAKSTDDAAYLPPLDHALAHISAYRPGALVIALGLDAYVDDPLQGMALSTAGFEKIGARIAKIGLPTVLVQEGGYLCDDLGRNLTAFMTGFQSGQE